MRQSLDSKSRDRSAQLAVHFQSQVLTGPRSIGLLRCGRADQEKAMINPWSSLTRSLWRWSAAQDAVEDELV